MIQLSGESLSKRHRELNIKVNEAVTNNANFDELKTGTEKSDVDVLFKIDLAAKYKNTDYIVEVLKSGDSLYISRALKKCPWLFNDEFSGVINTDYLHHNIFPFMSIKMMKKLMTTISINLGNESRAEDFYKYCLRTKLNGIADKFLISTSEAFKLNLIQNDVLNMEIDGLKSLISNSFTLLEAYLDKQREYKRDELVLSLTYFYSISSIKYLDLLEKHVMKQDRRSNKLGLKISKCIMTKHKERVLAKPCLYVNILSMSKIVRHSSAEDAKVYIASLMPQQQDEFWNRNFCKTYVAFFELLPAGERYGFIKKLYLDHYPNGEFETTKLFYEQKCYNLMTSTEREVWALYHINSGNELLGSGRDYKWYKFVNFEKAIIEIKKYIKVTTNASSRNDIIKILVESAKTQRELETLFTYYYNRHVNEAIGHKLGFLNCVLSEHNVLGFDEGSWEAFDKLLSSIEVYNTSRKIDNADYKIVAILYKILHRKEIPNALTQYMDLNISMYSLKTHLQKLNSEEKQVIYNYLFDYYLQRISKFNTMSDDMLRSDNIKSDVNTYIHFFLELLALFNKTKLDIPELVMRFVKLDAKCFRYVQILEEKTETLTESQLLKSLKLDAKQVLNKFELIENTVSGDSDFRLKRLLKKIKIYFSNDIANEFMDFFLNKLLVRQSTNYLYSNKEKMAVYGIFQLGSDKVKEEFMNKYAPENSKIDHKNIDAAVLNIQEAICRFACYSRPPVPLSNILMYLKGDYVKYCLPMFNMYLSNLPLPLSLKFIQATINAPVSVQKHGLRLAFKCFPKDNLIELITNTWKNTKNVSLRSVIYKAFIDKAIEEDDRELFNLLKKLTSDLHEDDDDALFDILTSNKLSSEFLGEYLEVAWNTVDRFTNKEINILRRTKVLQKIENNINIFKKDVVKNLVHEVLKRVMASTGSDKNYAETDMNKAMWKLIASYIVHFTIIEQDRLENVTFTKAIVKQFLDKWEEDAGELYVYRKNFMDFINNLQTCDFDTADYSSANCIFEVVLEELQKALPLHKIYLLVWELRLTIINRGFIEEGRQRFKQNEKLDAIIDAAIIFGKAIGDIIKEFSQNNLYYSQLVSKIVDFIREGGRNVLLHISFETGNQFLTYDRILVEISRGLINSDMIQAYQLALQLLPNDPDCDEEVYKSVFNKIRDFPDAEVQTCMYEKFYSDCKKRRFM